MTSKQELESKSFINLGVVTNNKGEVLVIKRAKEETSEATGASLVWAFPGGKQKIDESRRDCVEREVLLETGYKIASIREISMRFHPDFPVVVVYHLCQLAKPGPVDEIKEPWEVAEVRWVKPKDLKQLFTSNLDLKVAKELGI